MAVQQNKKSPSKRGMHRSHDALSAIRRSRSSRPPAKCTCATTSARPATTAARRSSRPRTNSALARRCGAGRALDAGPASRRGGGCDGRDGCRRLHGRRPRRARHGAGGAGLPAARSGASLASWSGSAKRSSASSRAGARRPARASDPACDRSGGDGRAARDGAARQEGFVDARRGRPRQGGRGGGLRQRRQHRRPDGDLALRAEDAARHRPAGDRDDPAHARRATPTCSTSAPTSTARPSTCCSSASCARSS